VEERGTVLVALKAGEKLWDLTWMAGLIVGLFGWKGSQARRKENNNN